MKSILLALFIIPIQIQFGHAQVDRTSIHLNEVIIQENRLQIPAGSQNRNLVVLTKEQIAA